MLTLAFPYTSAIAGNVLCYTLTPELADAWDRLTRQHRINGNARNLPYADLSQAFRFVLGDFAAIGRGPQDNQTLVLTRRQPPDGLIPRLFGEFERDLARRHDRPFQDQLAPLLADLAPKQMSIAEYLDATGPTGEPAVPSWVYDVATWHAIELLGARPLMLPNGRKLEMRADTDGNLLAWQDLLPGGQVDRRREPAMHYLSLKAITVPGHPGLVLSIDAHVSRLTYFFPHARNVWLATDPSRLVLTRGYHYERSTRRRTLKGFTAQLVDSFSLHGIPTQLEDNLLYSDPDRVRARYHSTPTRHTVGSGPGRKFLDAVLTHALACLPKGSTPLELIDSTIRVIDRPTSAKKDVATPGGRIGLAETLQATGQRLDLTVLFSTDEARARAINAIATALEIEPDRMHPAGTPAELIPGHLRVSFTHASRNDLLTPGPDPVARRAVADSVAQSCTADWIGAVLAETDSAAALADGVPTKNDPKRQARRELARHGIVSQYLDTASAPKPGKVDYPATNALSDLLRATGLTGTVPGRVFDPPLKPQPMVLVGIHSREQHNPALRVISLAATVTDGTDAPWATLGYHPDAGGWRPYPTTTAAHHATTISPFDSGLSYTARITKAVNYTHRALDQLLIRHPDLPVVLFLDGVGCRSLWPGLTNKRLGLNEPGALPHLGLANASDRQVALVRVTTNDDGELFQPVRACTFASLSDSTLDDLVPASTKLYRLNDHTSAYYLVNRSRTDQAYDQDIRASHRKTRFDIEDNPKTLSAAWHAMTCTEFTIIDPGSWTTDQLAALGARLCGHPLVWDGRTSRPVPLHLARQIVQDHPERT